jgi:DNA-binding NarL/FixJ family response regulator
MPAAVSCWSIDLGHALNSSIFALLSWSASDTAREAVMLRILVVDDDLPNMPGFEAIRVFHQRAPTISAFASSGPEADNLACSRMALSASGGLT